MALPQSCVADVVKLQNLYVSFPATSGKGEIRVLHDVTLTAAAGEFVGLLGPSGCGKSTLLRAVAGLVQVKDSAQVTVLPEIAADPLALSMNFQKPVLLPWLSVEQNALLPFEASGTPIDDVARSRLEGLLAITGLVGFRHALPSQLSGGMQMRAALVRSFVTEPRLLLMDEPFASLDELTRTRLGLDVRSMAKRTGATVLFVTHSVQEAVLLSDRIISLSSRPAHIVDEFNILLGENRSSELIDDAEYIRTSAAIRKRVVHG